EWGDMGAMYTVEWDKLMLIGEEAEKYPRLAKALDRMRSDSDTKALDTYLELMDTYTAMKEDGGFSPELTDKGSLSVRRADDRILSLVCEFDAYWGGAHPSYGLACINYDPDSGRELLIGDVVEDWESLPSVLGDVLTENYPDMGYEDYETILSDFLETDYNWSMDYQGISFYFNPYDIAPYASGLLEARIWFDEYPELFCGEFLETPEGAWAVELPDSYAVDFDAKPDDGKRDKVSVWIGYSEDFYGGNIVIGLNGDEYEGDYAFETDSYLVHDGEGGWYLYVIGTQENDYRTLYIYDIGGGRTKYIGELSCAGMPGVWFDDMGNYGEYYKAVLTDPGDFTLSTRMNLLGTYSAFKDYYLDTASGMPRSDNEYYSIHAETASIVSKIGLEVAIIPDMKHTIISAGTEFSFLRTDGESWVEMRLDDGRECRIELELSDWYCTIGGVSEWECFEQLYYAG
ncbi:MAG: DUF3298 domain-containing protein, partial [Clostridia bacterium]|nr:DUF3298 domain-containing protein [Clostridia bacterium]